LKQPEEILFFLANSLHLSRGKILAVPIHRSSDLPIPDLLCLRVSEVLVYQRSSAQISGTKWVFFWLQLCCAARRAIHLAPLLSILIVMDFRSDSATLTSTSAELAGELELARFFTPIVYAPGARPWKENLPFWSDVA
jgi:hypothetical protein